MHVDSQSHIHPPSQTVCIHDIQEDTLRKKPEYTHTEILLLPLVCVFWQEKIKKALGTASLDAVKSKRRKGALSHTRREEKKQPSKKNYAWSDKGELQQKDDGGKAGWFGGMVEGVLVCA